MSTEPLANLARIGRDGKQFVAKMSCFAEA
jgi:hypothetical protein